MSEDEHIDTTGVSPEVQSMPVEAMERVVESRKSNEPPTKPTLFEGARESELDKKLGKIFDKSTARDDVVLGKRDVPSAKTNSLDEAFAATFDWLNAPEAEKQVRRDADKAIDDMIANAKNIGLKMTREEAATKLWERDHMQEAQDQANAVNEWAPAAQEIQKFYPNEQPAAIAAEYARLEGRFRADPVAGFGEMANGIGVHPVQLAQQVIARYSQQQPQISQADYQRANDIVVRTAQSLPRYDELEGDMLAIIQDGNFKKTGDYSADLKRAYNTAVQRDKKRSTNDRLDRSLNAVYDAAQRRAGR